jgi:UDP-glucuronate 4-epimerase
MQVLVTGGAGFIGYHLIEALLSTAVQISAVDNLNDDYAVDLKQARLERVAHHQRLRFVRLDSADRQAVAKLFDDRRFNGLFHENAH